LSFTDLRARVSDSIARRRAADRAQALRARLISLTDAAGPRERERLRQLVADTADADLATIEGPVTDAVAAYSRAEARDEVTRCLVEALQRNGYQATADAVDVLRDGFEDADAAAVVLPSVTYPGYGLRVSRVGDRIHTAVVRRADEAAQSHAATLAVQRGMCAEIEKVEAEVAQDGFELTRAWRREPNGDVPTEDARHWTYAGPDETLKRLKEWDLRRRHRPKAKGRGGA
jgi:hypothetical protein